ncbi:hypothetical protein [Kitasatospora sp. NPDC002965]|uniref:hypothetical protein n=1 Tax=Kitasatospora sp. NPDC002965 TaxID=3154775 RepID=UPI00339E596E
MTSPRPSETAQSAVEAIRELNHLTLNRKMTAPEIKATVQEITALVDHLPQLFEQLARQLGSRQAEGAIEMDTQDDPAVIVPEVLARLAEAAGLTEPANRITYGTPAGPLSKALHDAASSLYQMSHKGNLDGYKDSADV